MVLILIFAEVLGLYGYGFIVAAVSIQRLANALTGQTYRCTDNEHQSIGCIRVFMTYVTILLSPAHAHVESVMHILLIQHPEQYKIRVGIATRRF